MAKTASPGVVAVNGQEFAANVVPDVFDARDLDYRPRLQPLPAAPNYRAGERHVMTQVGNSCTGHAVAAMINAVLPPDDVAARVSPYMLYRLARRYDEFEGDEDMGSSLRGALKGWYYHGVVPETDWPSDPEATGPDVDHDASFAELAARRPLGAFYRVNSARLDDMQSAVIELSALAVSAAIHEGWKEPVPWTDSAGNQFAVISRPKTAKTLGGHAFCIVGYNDIGFVVQNSWGQGWGKDGFAILPYDDWLDSAYDAWVARPGVYSIISERNRRKMVSLASGQGLVNAPGPNLARLAYHVVNLGNDGRLSRTGRATSSPVQLDKIFDWMGKYHELWADQPRRILLYAHGGLNSESTGLVIAQRQLNWWLSNRIYPVTFAWETGPAETLLDQLSDLTRGRMPSGGLGFNLIEQFDRLVESLARRSLSWMWKQMKQNAELASAELDGQQAATDQPGASLTVQRLKKYLDHEVPEGTSSEVHLVGHSAGSIFLAHLLARLAEAEVPVASMTFLAPAIRTDEWVSKVLPHLRNGDVGRFASFGMNESRELDDSCGAFYQKSLLYLVSRALEEPDPGQKEVPLVGMAHFANTLVNGTTLSDEVAASDLVWSPTSTPTHSRSDSSSHGGFDDDTATMTSVAMRILGTGDALSAGEYEAYRPSTVPEPLPTDAPPSAHAEAPPLAPAEVQPTTPVPVTTTVAPAAGGAPSTPDDDEPADELSAALLRNDYTRD